MSLDISEEGAEIILQHDIETILVTTDLGPARDQIFKLRKGLQVIKQNIVTYIRNALVKDQRSINKALLESICYESSDP